MPGSLRLRLASALIFLHLDYCCAVFTDITSEQDVKLSKAMNACLRFMYGVKKDDHITSYYKRARWLKVSVRRQYFVRCLLFNILRTTSVSSH